MSTGNGGRKRLIEAFEASSNKRSRKFPSDFPLHGVAACLTGLTSDRKAALHSLVERLGGRYTREFNLDKNTHLVAEVAQGQKYDLAVAHPRIRIVTPAWLEACSESGLHEDESEFTVPSKKSAPESSASMAQLLAGILQGTPDKFRSLFEFHEFFLVGFEEDLELRQKLGKLIRRGKGTVYWDLNENASILIVHNNCSEALHKAARVISNNHPKFPPAVSPLWVVESWRQNQLVQFAKFPPVISKPSVVSRGNSLLSKPPMSRGASSTSSMFRGILFALARISPPAWAVDFDSSHLESTISSQGGQILTQKLVDAMRADYRKNRKRRKCYVLCWGGRVRLDLNPILSQLKKENVCELRLVTPIWLQTCITTQSIVQPDRFPVALMPQSWPLRKFERDLCISLTGFQRTEKAVLAHLIESCGATFRNEMSTSNTHLICKEIKEGKKLQKAVEWKLEIVSPTWLYHVVEYGYQGKEKNKLGCESQFRLKDGE